jgi:hypothetical protein
MFSPVELLIASKLNARKEKSSFVGAEKYVTLNCIYSLIKR